MSRAEVTTCLCLILTFTILYLLQFSSVAQLCPTLCDLMNCSTPGLPVHHQLPEFIQTHIHQVSDAIGKNTQKNCTKKIFTTQIIMMV